jgi:hypothetical protein
MKSVPAALRNHIYDPRNHTKPHEKSPIFVLVSVISWIVRQLTREETYDSS